MNISYSVKYIGARTRPFMARGKYRGSGSIEFSDYGVRFSGRHVLSPAARWEIGLALSFGYLIVMAGSFASGFLFLFWPGFLLISLIMEYVWLKREETLVSYSDILNYIAKPKHQSVAIDYNGSKCCAPIVLRSEKWSEIVAMLRETIPGRDASLTVLRPSSGAAIYLSSLVFLLLHNFRLDFLGY